MAAPSQLDDSTGADAVAIGAAAKTSWPELLGVHVDEAIAIIERERPDMLMVTPTPEGRIVSADIAARRVRIWHGPDRRVTRVPVIG
jgi:hypothetical protein